MKAVGQNIGLRCIKGLNIVLMALPQAILWFALYGSHERLTDWLAVGLYMLLYFLCGRVYEAFPVASFPLRRMIYSQSLAALIADVLAFVGVWIMLGKLPVLWIWLLSLGVQIALSALWCFAARCWYFRCYPPLNTVVVYDMRPGIENLFEKYDLTDKFRVIHTVPVGQVLDKPDLLRKWKAEAVFFGGVHSHDRNVLLKYCVEQGIEAYVIPRVGDMLMAAGQSVHMFHLPVLRVVGYQPSAGYSAVKRGADILLSALALVILSPLMLGIAAAVKTDGGPVFYRQKRQTKSGREFMILKFRSMSVCEDGEVRMNSVGDERVTRVGRFLRRFHLDELPQFLNVLGGSMSLVGPRPEWIELTRQYEDEIPEFRLRLQVKAGLTGYAQVYGKYSTHPYDKLLLDLYYIAHPSVLLDLKIMLATLKTLFLPENSEGASRGQRTALETRDGQEDEK